MDIKTTFLHEDLKEIVYIKQYGDFVYDKYTVFLLEKIVWIESAK